MTGARLAVRWKADGATFRGADAAAVVAAMRDASPFTAGATLAAYMAGVRDRLGDDIPADDPAAFLEALVRGGHVEAVP